MTLWKLFSLSVSHLSAVKLKNMKLMSGTAVSQRESIKMTDILHYR